MMKRLIDFVERERAKKKKTRIITDGRESVYIYIYEMYSGGLLPGYHVFGNVFFCRRMNALHVCDDTCCYLSARPEWRCPVSGRTRMEDAEGRDVTMTMETTTQGIAGKRNRGGGGEERETITYGNNNNNNNNNNVCHAAGMEKRMRT